MSFQAYLDSIEAKTGKTPDDFRALAREKGLLEPGTKPAAIVAWLKEDFGLGHGHAMAIVAVFQRASAPARGADERIDEHFAGERSRWRAGYDALLAEVEKFGAGVSVAPTKSYLSLLKGKKKFAILQVTVGRMDVGIKLEGVAPTDRLESAGSWSSMVTHRVRIREPSQLDAALIGWLRQAHDGL